MSEPRLLSTEEQIQWQELSLHVQWAERFSLIILFVQDALLAESFKQRLDNQLKGHVSRLHVFTPNNPPQLSQDIFNELRQLIIPHTIVPCWLELHLQRDEQWLKAMDNFFARFNERRDLIRRDYPRPFIILVPLDYKNRLRTIAPDLWSVRSHSDELHAASIKPKFELNQQRFVINPAPINLNENALNNPAIIEWQRVKDKIIDSEELYLVTDNAFEAAFNLADWALAKNLAQQLITLSHSIINNDTENNSALGYLGVALERLGNVENAVGDYEAAYRTYTESLKISIELAQQLNNSPQVLRALSVALNKVANIDELLGRYELALKAYSQSLQICRDLKTTHGATPQALRDLSVSLNNVATIDKTLGRYELALNGYSESLQIFRDLKTTHGATPQVLRDLSVALDNVATIDKTLGRYELALNGYSESLQICRDLKTTQGATPQVLRDLSIALIKVANINEILEHYELALSGYNESLQIFRDLKIAVGATPQVLRDLSVSLDNVADINYYLENYGQALDSYNESLQICRDLKKAHGASPQVLNDLAVSLQKVGDCYYQMQQSAQALACYQECLPLLERLHAAQSFDDGYSARINALKAIIETL